MSPERAGAGADWCPRTLTRLRRELKDDDGSMMAELVRIYLTSTPKLLQQMDAAASRGDADDVRSLAHQVKGMTSTVGGLRLTALCDEIERGEWAEPAAAALVLISSAYEALSDRLEEFVTTIEAAS